MKKLLNKTEGIFTFSDYKKVKGKIIYAVLMLFLCISFLISVFPPVWLFVSSFKEAAELYSVPYRFFPKNFDIKKILTVWNYLNFSKYFINSFIVIIGACISSVIFNGLLAYSVSIIKPIGYRFINALITMSLMIPAITSMGVLFSNITKLNLINNYIPLWLAFGANAMYFLMMKNYFDSLPKALIEAAKLDGCNKLQIFYHIILRLSLPIIMVVLIFTVNGAWSDFLLPYLVLRQDDLRTVMVKIFDLQSNMGVSGNFGPDELLMVLSFSIVPPVILFAFFQKYITAAAASAGIKE
ncbi:MAG TPA: carbohydrate ABC transporter permease [Clostridia bacterium]